MPFSPNRRVERRDTRSVSPRQSHEGVLLTHVSAVLAQGVLHARGKGADGPVIEVDVRERGEKSIGEQLRYLTRMLAILFADLRETDQAADKNIL